MQFALLVRLGYSWYRNCLCALNNSKLKHKQLRSMDRKSYHIIYLSSQISSSLYSDCGIELSFSAGIMYLSLPIRIIRFLSFRPVYIQFRNIVQSCFRGTFRGNMFFLEQNSSPAYSGIYFLAFRDKLACHMLCIYIYTKAVRS